MSDVSGRCEHCRARIIQRHYLSVEGFGEPLPLFAESYACGAVQLYGLVEGDGVARTCPNIDEVEWRSSHGPGRRDGEGAR